MESRQAQIETHLEWTKMMFPQIRRILVRNAGVVMNIREASPQEDMTQGFDLILEMNNKEIAVRCRKPQHTVKYRDLTIRAKVPNPDMETEIHKVRQGKGDLYLYCWTDGKCDCPKIIEYIIIDLNKARKAGIFNADRKLIDNGDGTGFFAYGLQELADVGALVIREDLSFQRDTGIIPYVSTNTAQV